MEMHKIVKKLDEKMGKILTFSDIEGLISGESRERTAQIIYTLKGRGLLESIRKGLYFVASPDVRYSRENHYWNLIKILIKEEAGGKGIIAGEKSLEMLMMDYSLPEKLIIYTPTTNKRIRISPGHEVILTHTKSGKKEGYKNLFSSLQKMSIHTDVLGEKLLVLGFEAALLDTLTLHTHEEGVTETLVLKFLKRFHEKIDEARLRSLVKLRYIRALNRLRAITKTHGYISLYNLSLDIIKKEGGGCFVSF